jgi:O-antigen ligase
MTGNGVPAAVLGIRFSEGRTSVTGAPASYWLLLAFLFLLYANLPMIYPPLDAVRPAKIVAGAAIVMLLAETLFGQTQLELPWPEGYLLLGFLIAAALSCLTALWPKHAVEAVSDLIKMALVYFFIVNSATTVRRLRGVMWTIVIGGLFPAAGALKNYLSGDMVDGRAAWIGIFGNPNELAYSLIILVPIAAFLAAGLSWMPRLALLGIIGVYLAAIFISFSRGGLVGLAAVAVLIGWRKRNIYLQVVLVAAMIGGLMFASRHWSRSENFSNLQTDNSFRQRLATSRVGLAIFADHPLLGVGLGCSVVAWPLYAPKDLYSRGALVTHNTAIQPLAETGIPGFLCFTCFIGVAIYCARKLALLLPVSRGAARSAGLVVLAPPPHSQNIANLGAGLEIALWGFVVCGLSGGYVLTWFPYILAGMVSAARRIKGEA